MSQALMDVKKFIEGLPFELKKDGKAVFLKHPEATLKAIELCKKCDDVDPSAVYHWESMFYGFAIASGISYEGDVSEAFLFSLYAQSLVFD